MNKKKDGGKQMMLPFEYKDKVRAFSEAYEKIGKTINDLVAHGPEPPACEPPDH